MKRESVGRNLGLASPAPFCLLTAGEIKMLKFRFRPLRLLMSLPIILIFNNPALAADKNMPNESSTRKEPPVATPYHHKKRQGVASLLPQTLHAGVLKEGVHMNLELVKQTGQVYLYAQTKMGEGVPSQKLEMTATVRPMAEELPIPEPIKDFRNPPPTPTPSTHSTHSTPFPEKKIALLPDVDHFKALIDLRVPYILVVKAKPKGQAKTEPETFEFSVQP